MRVGKMPSVLLSLRPTQLWKAEIAASVAEEKDVGRTHQLESMLAGEMVTVSQRAPKNL